MRQREYAHLIWRGANEPPHLLYELKAYIHIQDPQNDKEPSGYGGTNDTTSPAKSAEPVANGGSRSGDYDRSDDHDTRIDAVCQRVGNRSHFSSPLFEVGRCSDWDERLITIRRVPQGEESAYSDRPLTGCYKATCHEVDGLDCINTEAVRMVDVGLPRCGLRQEHAWTVVSRWMLEFRMHKYHLRPKV